MCVFEGRRNDAPQGALGLKQAVCFLMDPNQGSLSCRRAGDAEQTINRNEESIIWPPEKEIRKSQFSMFSRKYSKKKISLKIMFIR